MKIDEQRSPTRMVTVCCACGNWFAASDCGADLSCGKCIVVKKRPTAWRGRHASLLNRDGFACHWCRRQLAANTATIDHLIPRSRGGSNGLDNCVLSCGPCNWRRGNAMPEFQSQHGAGVATVTIQQQLERGLHFGFGIVPPPLPDSATQQRQGP